VFGRKGDGYVGLYSERVPRWRPAPEGTFTHGLTEPFDVVAEGGPDNVWIVEVGRKADSGSFGEFRDALLAAPVEITHAESEPVQHRVRFVSPSQGALVYSVVQGSPGNVTVDGKATRLRNYPRFDTPWTDARFQARRFEIQEDGARLELDFDRSIREASK
jgi:hypothetical protein